MLQNVLQRLDQAFVNFFDKRTRFPHFKDKFRFRSITYSQARPSSFRKDGYVYLPKIGWVRMIAHMPFDPVNVKLINVKYHAGKWVANITDRTENAIPIGNAQNAVGLDLGLLSLVATSDGEFFENPKWLQKSEKRLYATNANWQGSRREAIIARKPSTLCKGFMIMWPTSVKIICTR